MEDIGLFNQGLKWLQSKDCYAVARTAVSCLRTRLEFSWSGIGRLFVVGVPNLGELCSSCWFIGKTVLFLASSHLLGWDQQLAGHYVELLPKLDIDVMPSICAC
ncbi:UNVERIFIED_CONTAM: hypothetical protein Sradi_6032800 [Sesamum radiatum]|uniref:Uncharacterized protein n=1 Tax=Sesamum radiatum TaxID=300843 RepID=A0AAW2KGW0_SESRA